MSVTLGDALEITCWMLLSVFSCAAGGHRAQRHAGAGMESTHASGRLVEVQWAARDFARPCDEIPGHRTCPTRLLASPGEGCTWR